jgi:hypothetical protein
VFLLGTHVTFLPLVTVLEVHVLLLIIQFVNRYFRKLILKFK